MTAPADALRFAFSAFYTFSDNVAEPPTGSQLRLNAGAPYDTVSKVWVRYLTTDGIDGYYALMDVPTGSDLFLQDKNDHTRSAIFRTIAAPVDKSGYVEYAVLAGGSSSTTFVNTQAVMLAPFVPESTGPAPEPEPEPIPPGEFSHIVIPVPLVSLSVAKDHLHITDTTHDADITAKLEAAQDLVIAKLGPAADATWTETTVPRPVRHSMLILLDAFYERRGGDEGANELRKALETVDLLIALYHDPALA